MPRGTASRTAPVDRPTPPLARTAAPASAPAHACADAASGAPHPGAGHGAGDPRREPTGPGTAARARTSRPAGRTPAGPRPVRR